MSGDETIIGSPTRAVGSPSEKSPSPQRNHRARVLAIVVTKEDPSSTVTSLEAQTVKPDGIVVSNHVFKGVAVGRRIAKSINLTLGEVDWRSFDYLLRVDGDSILSTRFIEDALAQDVDIVGTGGSGILFRREVLEAMGSRWPIYDSEDTYFLWKSRSLGFAQNPSRIRSKMRPFGSNYSLAQFINWGCTSYEMGYEPIGYVRNVLVGTAAAKRPTFLLTIPAYLACMLVRRRKTDVAPFVTRAQVGFLAHGLRKALSRG